VAAAFQILSQSCYWGEHILIFLCLGTQEFQFDRLLEKVDELIAKKVIREEVFAQVGFSTFKASGLSCIKFLSSDVFDTFLDNCSYVITHGGTGTIIKALRKGKRVIAVPRMKKYGEHVDDHQKEIISTFSEKNFIYGLEDTDQLEEAVSRIDSFVPESFVSGNSKIISIIDNFIRSCG
jgi:UDP-N-acetylglucosamine transferase subunit ALG13